MRGDIHRLNLPRTRGGEQAGPRYAVVVQSDDLPLWTVIVAPTSTSAGPAVFRPEIMIDGEATRVLVEQAAAVDPSRLGAYAGVASADEVAAIDEALRLVLDL